MMAKQQQMRISDPLVVMFRASDGQVITHIHRPPDLGYESYGLMVCGLVRHVANAYQVPEYAVWEWVEKERRQPTTTISQPS
jgi:hypothetical protein